jgi:hypothetical protein
MISMGKGLTELQKITDNLNSMERELEEIQGKMKENMILRVGLLGKIVELLKTDEREIVVEKTQRIRLRQRKKTIK